jgi:hypothetical protein
MAQKHGAKLMRNIIKNGLYLSLLVASTTASAVNIGYFRTPYITERGPMRYIMPHEEHFSDNKDCWNIHMWSAVYSKEAHKAYIKHGTNTKSLANLYFGADSFRWREIFPESNVPLTSEFYNPYMKVLRYKPCVTYSEYGTNLGARIEAPVWCGCGRLGLRASIPFKTIEMQRNDQGTRDDTENADVIAATQGAFRLDFAPGGDEVFFEAGTRSVAYRLDFVEALAVSDFNREPMLQFTNGNGFDQNGDVKIAGQSVTFRPNEGNISDPRQGSPDGAGAAFLHSPEGIVPPRNLNVSKIGTPPNDLNGGPGAIPNPITQALFDSPTFNDVNDPDEVYTFARGLNLQYVPLSEASKTTPQERLADNNLKATIWVVPTTEIDGQLSDPTATMQSALAKAADQYTENTFEWLFDRGWVFKTKRRSGLGDLLVELFYEHTFDECLVGELMLGVVFPTAGSNGYTGNQYQPILGNGGHFEIKLGGMIAYQPLNWMNLKLDAYYSFVLEAKEQRAAAFKGAQIKNIGPKAVADVDWGYFVGRLDFNFFHPQTCQLSSLLGYELYIKQKDHVRFKKSKLASWLGRTYIPVTSPTSPDQNKFEENLAELDNGLAEKHTDSISHKVRCETSYRFSEYFEMFAGATYVFAGKNVPCETDCHVGFHVSF